MNIKQAWSNAFYRKNLLACNDDEKSYQCCVLPMLKMNVSLIPVEKVKRKEIFGNMKGS